MNPSRFALILTCCLLVSGLTDAAHSQTFNPPDLNNPTKPDPNYVPPVRPPKLYLPPLVDKSAFPAYDKDSYAKMLMKQTRAKTVWSAPTRQEQSMLQSVSESQLQQGVEDPKTLDLSWKTAAYFFKIQKYNQAEPLLKEIVATIESHPQTPQSKAILEDAKKKLIEINEARAKRFLPGPVKFQFPRMIPRKGLGNSSFSPSSSSSPNSPSSGSSSSSPSSSGSPSFVSPPVTLPSNAREVPGVEFEFKSKSGFDYNKLKGN
jgi:hypothetical protein